MRFGLKMPLAALVLGGVILAAGGDFDILTFRKLGALEQSFTPASEIFVSPQWLEENFHQVRLLDAGRSLNDFKDQHILGAGRIDIYKLQDCIFRLQAEDDYRNLLEIIERAGVFKNRPVVVYDTGDGIEAAYLFWLLEYLGHP
ncbi:MAG: hypothetical protein D6B26_04595, partial [Spirochaetaceae bacterium]